MERLKKNLSNHKSEANSFIGFPKALPISLTINTNQYWISTQHKRRERETSRCFFFLNLPTTITRERRPRLGCPLSSTSMINANGKIIINMNTCRLRVPFQHKSTQRRLSLRAIVWETNGGGGGLFTACRETYVVSGFHNRTTQKNGTIWKTFIFRLDQDRIRVVGCYELIGIAQFMHMSRKATQLYVPFVWSIRMWNFLSEIVWDRT